MVDYLETVITVLIGLGAYLISVISRGKKGNAAASSAADSDMPSTQEFELENKQSNGSETYLTDYSESEDDTNIVRPTNEMSNHKYSAMREDESTINDPPVPQMAKSSGMDNYSTSGEVITTRKVTKKPFNAKKAIIYDAIINRKYF
ncbi:MAG: hypothetical protein PF489_02005 [Salinivirgaceae bacterium]|jgi:hypothetical protein|nr:hypothetical protein [Salinivirgaceae bacterium]